MSNMQRAGSNGPAPGVRPAPPSNPPAAPPIAMWWDGGERAITAREKALIEEHSASSFNIPLVAAPTSSSRWAAEGKADPHGLHYDCERSALTLGHYTDDELANAVFLHGDEKPTLADLVAGKALSGIVYLTAAKDRIRWLSRALSSAIAATGKQSLSVAATASPEMLGATVPEIRIVKIPRRNNLDPIDVFVQDYELGRGRIVITCHGQAWCGFWSAMGARTVMQFVAECDADYVAGNMISGRHGRTPKHERAYVERIAAEVIAEFRAMSDQRAAQEVSCG